MTEITGNFLISLMLSIAFLLVTIGAVLQYKAKLREYAGLGPEASEEKRKDLKKAELVWRWVIYIFSLLISVPLAIGLHFSFSVSNPSRFIIINLGGEFAAVIVVFLAVQAFKIKWRELFTSSISLGLCVTLALIGFLATLTTLTAVSLLPDPQLRQTLIGQFKKALGGK